jgi:hypothetical protein
MVLSNEFVKMCRYVYFFWVSRAKTRRGIGYHMHGDGVISSYLLRPSEDFFLCTVLDGAYIG